MPVRFDTDFKGDIPDDQPSTLAESGVPFEFETGGPYIEHDYTLTPEEEAELEDAMVEEGGLSGQLAMSQLEELERADEIRKRMH